MDCCPCLTTALACDCCDNDLDAENRTGGDNEGSVAAAAAPEQGAISKFMEFQYAPVLLQPPVRVGVCVAFLVLLGICCGLGLPNLTVEDNERSFITDGSYLLRTLNKDDKYFGAEGEVMYVVTEDVDYFAAQTGLTALRTDVAGVDVLRDPATTDSYDSVGGWLAEAKNASSLLLF